MKPSPPQNKQRTHSEHEESARAFARLVGIIARLRAPDGCPWDREQDHSSLRRHLIEETYEVVNAIESGDDNELQEELGDLLMQPVMHAQIAAEEERFAIADVLQSISDKLIRRHPHVFGQATVSDSGEVLSNWDAIKKEEKKQKGITENEGCSILGGIPPALPALMQALETSKKAAKAGFEWPAIEGVLEKTHEELQEVEEALQSGEQERITEELGDLLFTVVNLARWQKIDPELALRDTVRRFQTRFLHMEKLARQHNLELKVLSPQQWEEFWSAAKEEKAKE